MFITTKLIHQIVACCFFTWYIIFPGESLAINAAEIQKDTASTPTSSPAKFADEVDDVKSQPLLANGQSTLSIDEHFVALSGIQITELHPAQHQPELIANGIAIDIQPLIEIRRRYFIAKADYSSAKALFSQSQKNISRLQNLHRSEAVSTRKLQKQQAQWQSSNAQLEASRHQLEAIHNAAILEWGDKLTSWILAPDSEHFSALLARQRILLKVTLPPSRHLPDNLQSIFVQRDGLRNQAGKADLVSVAPVTDIALQGESYFFICSDGSLRTGMRLAAWIPLQRKELSGVIVPAAAIVWHLGQAYAYIQSGQGQFIRRMIPELTSLGNGYFIQHGIAPGEQLVSSGAQMLLSEEFRGQIPDEDDDE